MVLSLYFVQFNCWRRAVDEGQGPADLDGRDADTGGEEAVDDALAEPGREARGDAMAEDLLDERVAGRHAAGDGEMGDGRAGQPKEAERARPAAIERRQAADEAKDLGADKQEVDQGARRDRGHERDPLGRREHHAPRRPRRRAAAARSRRARSGRGRR